MKETTAEFKFDVGMGLIMSFTIFILTAIIPIQGKRPDELLMTLLHPFVCVALGFFFVVAPSKPAIQAYGVTDTSKVRKIIKLPLLVKWVIALLLAVGIRYVMAPKNTGRMLSFIFSGWTHPS